MIRTPKKFNNAYVQVDNTGAPLYGLTEVGNVITKIYPCKKDIQYVVLPEYGEINLDRYDIAESFKNQSELRYVQGQMVLADGCFEGMKKFKLILPAKTSVKIEPNAFDADAEVEFILPEDYELKTITKTATSEAAKNNQTPYTLIADKNVRISVFGEPIIIGSDYESNNIRGQISVNKEFFIRNGEFVSKKYDSYKFTEIE